MTCRGHEQLARCVHIELARGTLRPPSNLRRRPALSCRRAAQPLPGPLADADSRAPQQRRTRSTAWSLAGRAVAVARALRAKGQTRGSGRSGLAVLAITFASHNPRSTGIGRSPDLSDGTKAGRSATLANPVRQETPGSGVEPPGSPRSRSRRR